MTLATLARARLDRAVLREAVLDRTDLRGASLDGVDLSEAVLTRTQLDLAGAVLLAELHGAVVDASA
nr:pentapeptide repeat-containing protein [Nocardioides sp. zg-1308]